MGSFFEQFVFYICLALGITLFSAGFKPLSQVALSKVGPLHGMMEAASA